MPLYLVPKLACGPADPPSKNPLCPVCKRPFPDHSPEELEKHLGPPVDLKEPTQP